MDRISKLKESRRTQSAAGISNSTGQYNCFLNVVVQSLWHLTSFQGALQTFPDHKHQSEKSSCVLCALYTIFDEYRSSNGRNLSAVDLRQALSEAFAEQDRFQEGVMADAGECYIELVQLIERLLPTEESKTKLVHNLFDLVQVDRVVCSNCDHDSELPATTVNTLLLYISRLIETSQVLGEKPLDDLIGALHQQEAMNCPKCSKPNALVTKQIKSLPEVFTLSTVWPSSRPSRQLLNDFLNTISTQIDLQSIGAVDMKLKKTSNTNYHLRGMILYYGRHYTACFYHSSVGLWFRFDDSRVDPIGHHWHDVTDFCVRSRFQPSVLFYEREVPGQSYYESVPQDVIPRMLPVMESPNKRAQQSPNPSPACPSLEGPVHRKIKKNWSLCWLRLSNWTVSLYSRAQKTYAHAYGGWVQSRRDPPTLLMPISAITSIEHDSASHNFNRKPHYLKICALSDDSTSQEPTEVLLFVDGAEPFAQILSALTQAKEVLDKSVKGSARRQRSVIIDTAQLGLDYSRNGAAPNGARTETDALDFAPNASLEDLRRIAEMEAGTPRGEGSDEEETPTTVIGSPLPSPPPPSNPNSVPNIAPAQRSTNPYSTPLGYQYQQNPPAY